MSTQNCGTRRTLRHFQLFAGALAATLSQPLTTSAATAQTSQPVGACTTRQVCGFDDPEDLADMLGTAWLIVGEATELVAFNTRTHSRITLAAAGPEPACPANNRGGGIGLRREGAGFRLVRILHSGDDGPDAVATYALTLVRGQPSLRRTGCVIAPAAYFLNDIAPLPDGGFAATHMFDRKQPRQQRETAFLNQQPTGYVVRWSARKGWRRLPDTDGSFPNGLDVSRDGRFLAFAETYGHAINRIRLDGSDRRRLLLPMNPDNVIAMPHGRFSVVGGTGAPLVSTRACPQLRRPGCGFPALALSVDFTRAATQVLVSSEGTSAPGFSAGLVKDGAVYLGTAFGDRLTIVPISSPPTVLP